MLEYVYMTNAQFRTSGNPAQAATDYIAEVLKQKLSDKKKVLFLIPGGSAIKVAVLVMKALEGMDLANLTITLTDERYGESGHTDSSWEQLRQSGLILGNANIYPFLTGETIENTVAQCEEFMQKCIENSDYKIGLFGIGPDGHTAGILPESPAAESLDFISSYQGGAYLRVTVTPALISKLDEVVVYAVGENKKQTLKELEDEHPIRVQPAQALKHAGEFIIFND